MSATTSGEGDGAGNPGRLQDDLRVALLELAHRRGPGKSLCPSEAAAVVDAGRRRELTRVARAVACQLADEGLLEVTQRGRVVDGRTAPGPVRVRLRVPSDMEGC